MLSHFDLAPGLGHPLIPLPQFDSPTWLIDIFDVGRIGMLIVAAILIGYVVGVLDIFHARMSRWQRARFVSVLWGAISVAGTEVGRLHDVVTWRYLVNVLFLATASYGVWGLRHGRDSVPARLDKENE